MTDAEIDARLKGLLRADPPPARDASFRLAVQERLERRRAAVRLALVVGVGAAATLATAALSPELDRLLAPGMMAIAGAVLAGAASVWGVLQIRRPI